MKFFVFLLIFGVISPHQLISSRHMSLEDRATYEQLRASPYFLPCNTCTSIILSSLDYISEYNLEYLFTHLCYFSLKLSPKMCESLAQGVVEYIQAINTPHRAEMVCSLYTMCPRCPSSAFEALLKISSRAFTKNFKIQQSEITCHICLAYASDLKEIIFGQEVRIYEMVMNLATSFCEEEKFCNEFSDSIFHATYKELKKSLKNVKKYCIALELCTELSFTLEEIRAADEE